MEEAVSYGTPSLKVQGKFFARLREDGQSIALKIGFVERQELMEAHPEAFFVTDHYANYPAVVVSLAKVRRSTLAEVLANAWRRIAPRRLVTAYDEVARRGSRHDDE